MYVNHLPVPADQFPGCVPCLLWGADLRLRPSWQMSTVQDPRKTWLATGSLLTVRWRMPVSGAEIVPCLWLWLLHACLSASGGGEGPVHSQLALLSIPSILCSVSWPGCTLEPFTGKFSLSFFHLVIPLFGLLSHVCSLRLSSGHPGPGLPLRTDAAARGSLSSPHSLVADTSVWATSPLAAGVRLTFCVVAVFPASYVALCDSKTPHGPACERVSDCLEASPP